MDEIYFLIRFTPFWSIPILLLGVEFSYLFWLRKKKKAVFLCLALSFFCLISTVGYYLLGGPEKSVKAAMEFIWYYTS